MVYILHFEKDQLEYRSIAYQSNVDNIAIDFFRQLFYINVKEQIMMEFFLQLNDHHEYLE